MIIGAALAGVVFVVVHIAAWTEWARELDQRKARERRWR